MQRRGFCCSIRLLYYSSQGRSSYFKHSQAVNTPSPLSNEEGSHLIKINAVDSDRHTAAPWTNLFNSSDIEFEPAPSKAETHLPATEYHPRRRSSSYNLGAEPPEPALPSSSGCDVSMSVELPRCINQSTIFYGSGCYPFLRLYNWHSQTQRQRQAGPKPHGGDQGIWDHCFLWNVSVQQEERIRADCPR